VTIPRIESTLGTWGPPPDDVARVAAGLAVLAVLLVVTGRGRSILGMGPLPLPRKVFLWIAAFSAALLSILYIAHYLVGGPRIVDATTYFLQGRALAHGDFAWAPLEPSASFRGRFLVFRPDGATTSLGGIFPPGYPLLLALGFAIGAPMVVGPALAAALVVATYRLARTVAEESFGRRDGSHGDLVEAVARGAALLSVVCGALRYHTADTMSHGATALAITLALDAALRRRATIAGLAIGYVAATRPVSALAIGAVAAVLVAAPKEERWRRIRGLALGLVPGLALLLVAQHEVTGAWGISSQKMYYAQADGPPGCFRWGFGTEIGCLQEHGPFVEAHLGRGYGLVAAAGTTLRRLRMHLLDVANLEPLFLLVLVPVLRRPRTRGVVAATSLLVIHVLAYAPFYFDGNYPGGGARLFADALPVEHVLLVVGVARLATRFYVRALLATLALALSAFAVHAVHDHVKLQERDGGRPMFEPDVLSRLNVTQTALVFVDTDHGFALGHDPAARIKNGVVVARLRNDDRDRLLYDRLDHPTTYLYKLEAPPKTPGAPAAPFAPSLVPWAPAPLGTPLRFEAEAEWPALEQHAGFAAPGATDACAGGAKGLVLTPTPVSGLARATITLPVPETGRYAVGVRIVQDARIPHTVARGAGAAAGIVTIGAQKWDWVDLPGGGCTDLPSRDLDLVSPYATVTFEARGGAAAIDRFTLRRLR